MSGRQISLGLAGLGYWGPNLARNFDDLPGSRLASLCDLDSERRARFAARFPDARVTGSFEDLLEDASLEAVAIATPVVTHHELAKQALLAGKHVFVEKPLALTAEQAEELVALA